MFVVNPLLAIKRIPVDTGLDMFSESTVIKNNVEN